MSRSIVLFCFIASSIFSWFIWDNSDQAFKIVSSVEKAGGQFVAVFLSHNPKTIIALKSTYNASTAVGNKKVRILIVPGHEPNFGGTAFGNIIERDLNVELGLDLQKLLQKDNHYEVFITRDKDGWNPIFVNYFKNNWQDIQDWDNALRQEMAHLISIGSTTKPVATVYHNKAPQDVALRLYGITKWANENNVAIMLHIHLNDDPNHRKNVKGNYSGFTIYVPSEQYFNSKPSHAVSQAVFNRLAKESPVSNLPVESAGIVDEPGLIGLGINNSADAASILVEYGYIYESKFTDPNRRNQTLNDLAIQTYLAIQDYFNQKY